MKRDFRVAIVGAGLAGLATAALLSRTEQGERLRITVVDAAKRPAPPATDDYALRVSAIATGSVTVLERTGAWALLDKKRACAYERMRVWDESTAPDDPTTLSFDAAEFAVAQLGFIVENDRLHAALLEALAAAGIDWHFGTTVEGIEREAGACRVALAGGRRLDADLVIGADGADSVVRTLAGIETRDHPYGQVAIVTHLEPEQPHRNTALQRFLADGPLGILPLADGRVSVVWSGSAGKAEAAMQASDAQLSELLTRASDHVLGRLGVAGPRGRFTLRARHARSYVEPGIVLVGDAAHAVHPLAGQGANLGLRDAAVLAEVVGEALARGEHPGDRPVLRRYERRQKGRNATMLHFMTALNALFAIDAAPVRALRTTGMRLFNKSGPLREYMVGVAMGTGR
ncbi:MAG: FAD-dependent monooxygenase [Woeseiaceae bacterium]|nr:FAD-dependent monooxygenase [Woeseiaceae bacterium]